MFHVAAEAYGRFMGRYSEPLAAKFVQRVGVSQGQRALDVGCGPGALTAELVPRLGPQAVAAVDPSSPFVAALRARFPEVDVQQGTAEQLPFPDHSFDLTLAQLVVHFMIDPVAGLSEMRRVTRRGGRVGASVWDHAGGGGPLAVFWRAARDVDPAAPGEADLPGTGEGQLAQLSHAAGLREVEPFALTVELGFPTVLDWWEPFTLGVGPAGSYVSGLDDPGRAALHERCVQLLPPPPFTIRASAWCVLGRA